MSVNAIADVAIHQITAEVMQIWHSLSAQVTPSNSIITIPGDVFASLHPMDCLWMADQYLAIMGPFHPPIFVRDAQNGCIFLGSEPMFPAANLICYPGEMPLLKLDPTNNASTASLPASSATDDATQSTAGIGKQAAAKSSKIPRPANAFILYRKDYHQIVKDASPGIRNNDISVIIGAQWQIETAAVRQKYKKLAEQLKLEHALKYPEYSYKPRKPSEKKKRMTKKKAAAMNAAAPSEPDDPIDPSTMFELPDGKMPLPAVPVPVDWSELSGFWGGERTALIPSSVHLPNLIRRHNHQQIGVPTGGPSVPVDFRPSAEYEKAHFQDLDNVNWEQALANMNRSFAEEHDYYANIMPSDFMGDALPAYVDLDSE